MSQRRKLARAVARQGDTADVYVEGVIGSKDGTTAASFREQLARVKDCKTLRVHFNSVGGGVNEGMTIYNNLRALSCKKIGIVDGIAASIASVILMACDERRVAKGAYVMIHNPSIKADGGAEEFRKIAEDLTVMRGELLDIYETSTDIGRAELEKLLDAETYFTAEEAVKAGIADAIEDFEARLYLDAVARLDPSKVPAGLRAAAQAKGKKMKVKDKMKALEEEMKALKARNGEEEVENEEDDEDDDKPDPKDEDDDEATDEEEDSKNLASLALELTGAKSLRGAANKLAQIVNGAQTSAAQSRADLVSVAINVGKLAPSLKAHALRISDSAFNKLIRGGVAGLKLGPTHREPTNTKGKKPPESTEADEEELSESELKIMRLQGLKREDMFKARKTEMVYGKGVQQ